jgi:hypothetical protein
MTDVYVVDEKRREVVPSGVPLGLSDPPSPTKMDDGWWAIIDGKWWPVLPPAT